MANIKPYIDNIATAVYGEEVRGSIIDAITKVNDDNDSYIDIKNDIVDAKNDVDQKYTDFNSVYEAAKSTKTQLASTISNANTAKSQLGTTITNASTAKNQLQGTIDTAGTTKTQLESSASSAVADVNAAITRANTAKTNLDSSNVTATATNQNLQSSITSAASAKTALDGSVSTATVSKADLDSAVTAANTTKGQVIQEIDAKTSQSISEVNAAKNELAMVVGSAPSVTTTTNNALQAKCTRSGIEIMHIKGKTTQQTTHGYQLFDINQLKKDFGELINEKGIKVFFNPDGSYSSFGTATLDFFKAHDYTHDETVNLLHEGELKAVQYPSNIPYTAATLWNSSAEVVDGGEVNTAVKPQFNVTETFLSKPESYIRMALHQKINTTATARSFKPMFYQDGDGTWEPFTGGKPGPNPDYPLPLKSFEANKIVVMGSNVGAIPDTSISVYNCSFQNVKGSDNMLRIKVTGERWRIGLSPDPDNGIPLTEELGNAIPIPEDSKGIFVSMYGDKATVYMECSYFDKFKNPLGNKRLNDSGSLVIPQDARYVVLAIRDKNSPSVATGSILNFGFTMSFDRLLDPCPAYYEEIELTEPLVLRSCATGECDEYLGDGKIIRRCEYIKILNGVQNKGNLQFFKYNSGTHQTISISVTSRNGTLPGYEAGQAYPMYCDISQALSSSTAVHPSDIPPGKSFVRVDGLGYCGRYVKLPFITEEEARQYVNTHEINMIAPLLIPTFEDYPMPILPSWDDTCRAYFVSDTETEITWRPCPLSDPIKRVYELEQRSKALEDASQEPETPATPDTPAADQTEATTDQVTDTQGDIPQEHTEQPLSEQEETPVENASEESEEQS